MIETKYRLDILFDGKWIEYDTFYNYDAIMVQLNADGPMVNDYRVVEIKTTTLFDTTKEIV